MNALHARYNDTLVILAVPCNQFELQEPGKNHEIMNGLRYVRPGNNFIVGPHFHFLAKTEVNGKDEIPLYTFLKGQCHYTKEEIGEKEAMMYNPIRVNDITWNFEKFIISADGKPLWRFHPSTEIDQLFTYLDKAVSDIKKR